MPGKPFIPSSSYVFSLNTAFHITELINFKYTLMFVFGVTIKRRKSLKRIEEF